MSITSKTKARGTSNGSVACVSRARRRREAGSAILLVLFMAAAMFIAMSVIVPRIVTQGRRQREDELAWRGEQYVRAVRLYYRKYGRFPRTMEDFSKNPGNLHFLRKEYKEPMNEADGTWRFIYVGPAGQLVGSLTRKLPLGMIPIQGVGGAGAFGGQGQGASNLNASGNTAQPATSQSSLFGGNPNPNSTGQNPQQATQPAATDTSGAGTDPNAEAAPPAAPTAPKQGDANASTNDSTVFGGQIVGVASKINRKSIRFYKGYGKYREWEFIWDPAEDALAAGAASQPGLLQQPGGTLPTGTQPIVTPPSTPPQPQ